MAQLLLKRWIERAERVLFRPHRVRRIRGFLRYLVAKKQGPLSIAEMLQGRSLVNAKPVYLILEPGAICNLRCAFCPTPLGLSTLPRELLQPDTFSRIARHLPRENLFEASLFNWGEPFLNPHLPEYIAWFTKQGVQVVVHANFSARAYDDAFMAEIVNTGLTHLTVSIDGASQESYEKYRVGGNLERVFGNIRRLVRVREQLRSDTPRITYKMILNRFNQHEVDAAREIACELGVEFLLQENFGMPAEAREEWIADTLRESGGVPQMSSSNTLDAGGYTITECMQLWNTLVVSSDGDVLPCCQTWTRESAVGNIAREPFEAIWNNDKMQYLRRYVLDESLPPPDFPNACVGCPFRYCTYNRKQRAAREEQ